MTTNSTYGKPQVIVTGGGRSPDSVCHPAPPAPDVHPSLRHPAPPRPTPGNFLRHPAPPAPDVHPSLRHPAPPAPTPGDFVPKRMLTTPVAHV